MAKRKPADNYREEPASPERRICPPAGPPGPDIHLGKPTTRYIYERITGTIGRVLDSPHPPSQAGTVGTRYQSLWTPEPSGSKVSAASLATRRISATKSNCADRRGARVGFPGFGLDSRRAVLSIAFPATSTINGT